MIECKDVSVSISSRKIIERFNARFENGTVTSVLGKNGCGKTTLLKAISGICRSDGFIDIDGKPLTEYKKNDLSKVISLMPQVLSRPSITVNKLVEYGRSPYTGLGGILSARDREVVKEAVEKCEIRHLISKTIDGISGGEQRKAFFAMLVAQDTHNVLLDEPLANLDAEYSHKLIGLINELKLQNKAIIAVFHDINIALEHSDRLIFIDNGKCIFSGTPSDAVKEKIPENLFGMKKISYTENYTEKYFYR